MTPRATPQHPAHVAHRPEREGERVKTRAGACEGWREGVRGACRWPILLAWLTRRERLARLRACTGDLDLLVGNNDQANQLLVGNEDGAFADAIDLPGGSKYTRALSVGDVDGDGTALALSRGASV